MLIGVFDPLILLVAIIVIVTTAIVAVVPVIPAPTTVATAPAVTIICIIIQASTKSAGPGIMLRTVLLSGLAIIIFIVSTGAVLLIAITAVTGSISRPLRRLMIAIPRVPVAPVIGVGVTSRPITTVLRRGLMTGLRVIALLTGWSCRLHSRLLRGFGLTGLSSRPVAKCFAELTFFVLAER